MGQLEKMFELVWTGLVIFSFRVFSIMAQSFHFDWDEGITRCECQQFSERIKEKRKKERKKEREREKKWRVWRQKKQK